MDITKLSLDELDKLYLNTQFFAEGNPHVLWKRMRNEAPIRWTDAGLGRNFWSITKHEDVKFFLNDNERFSSQRYGASLPGHLDQVDPTKSEHARLVRAGYHLPMMDPPRHPIIREQFRANFFSPPLINALEKKVVEVATRILDENVKRSERIDFVTQIAAHLPMTMIFMIMDIPKDDWPMLFACANAHTAPEEVDFAMGKDAVETRKIASGKIIAYARELGRTRRENPGNDLISFMATMQVGGELLSLDQVGILGHMFIVAGQDTTRNTLGGGLLELIRNPEQMQRLRDNPDLIRRAPDEFLRYSSVVAHLLRAANVDVEYKGHHIKEDDWIVVWMASANRDEDVFIDPDVFDIGRTPNSHVSFGFGPHFCLGGHLAKLQMRVMLELLLERYQSIELVGKPEWVAANQFVGLKALPLKMS